MRPVEVLKSEELWSFDMYWFKVDIGVKGAEFTIFCRLEHALVVAEFEANRNHFRGTYEGDSWVNMNPDGENYIYVMKFGKFQITVESFNP